MLKRSMQTGPALVEREGQPRAAPTPEIGEGGYGPSQDLRGKAPRYNTAKTPAGGWSGARDGASQPETREGGRGLGCEGGKPAGSCGSGWSISRGRLPGTEAGAVLRRDLPEALMRGLLATHGCP